MLYYGMKLSYEKNGTGKPIILIHGNGQSNEFFAPHMQLFATAGYTVYAPDSRGHGKSAKVARLDYDDMAEDIAELIRDEKLQKPTLLGFSDGGIIGLLVAMKYPDILGKLYVAGVNLTPKGVKPMWRFLMRLVFVFTRSDKMRLMIKQPNIKAQQLRAITVPTTAFYAEKDIVKIADTRTVVENVRDGKLVFVPKENHGSYIADAKKLLDLIS